MAAHHCRITSVAACAMLDHLVDLSDVGGAGQLIIYTGAEPAYCDDADGTEVATCTLPNPAFGAAAAHGVDDCQASLLSTATDASATGNASAVTYFRLANNGGTDFLQGTCSATAGDDLVLNTAVIANGSQVDITALVLSLPFNQA